MKAYITACLTILVTFPCVTASHSPSARAVPGQKQNLPARPCDTPLVAAIHARNVELINKILREKPNLDGVSCPERQTALAESIVMDLPEVTAALLNAGADVNARDVKGASALNYAALYCREAATSLLISHQASPNQSDDTGYSPLMMASSACPDGRVAALLIRAGANVNATSKAGESPITTAAFAGNEIVVMELVASGADLDAKNDEGQTAFDLAKGREVGRRDSHDRIVSFLRSAKAGVSHMKLMSGPPISDAF